MYALHRPCFLGQESSGTPVRNTRLRDPSRLCDTFSLDAASATEFSAERKWEGDKVCKPTGRHIDIAPCSVSRCLRSQSLEIAENCGKLRLSSNLGSKKVDREGAIGVPSSLEWPSVGHVALLSGKIHPEPSRTSVYASKTGSSFAMSSNTQSNSPDRARGYKRRRDSASPTYFDQLNGQAESSTARNGNGANHESRPSSRDNGRDDGSTSAWDQVDDENYTPYVPLSKRRANLLSSLHQKSSVKTVKTKTTEEEVAEKEAIRKAEEEEEELRREKARKERTLLQEAQEVKKRQAEQGQ